MNDWWKLALAGTAGAGLLALTGGAAAPGLAALMGGEGAAAAGTAGALGAEAAAGTAAAAGASGATGAAGAAGLAGADAAAVGGLGGLGGVASGAGAGTAADAATAYVTPAVTEGLLSSGGAAAGEAGAGASGAGILGEVPVAEGAMPGAYSDVAGEQFAMANQNGGLLSQAGGYAKDGARAASAYNSVNGAMGGNAPPQQAPRPQPVYQGETAPIAPQQQSMPIQSPVMQSGGNATAMLQALAKKRLGRG